MGGKETQIRAAVCALRNGGLVAFPTETVYGLGADATHSAAVERIFWAKGRPPTNPLIVHVADTAIARRYAKHWPAAAEQLARRFWPGPLTLVVPKAPAIVPQVSAGLETVGLRAPDHPLALHLLREFDGPIAAPSANRANRVSPTAAEHVRKELGQAVEVILDGGPCSIGIESTVLDLSHEKPTILRPGAVTREQIESVIGPIGVFAAAVSASQPAQSPGQQAVHYAPSAPAYRFTAEQAPRVAQWLTRHGDATAVLLGWSDLSDLAGSPAARPRKIEMPRDPAAYARRLYAALHEADGSGVAAILIELPPSDLLWTAVRDRLCRATRPLPD